MITPLDFLSLATWILIISTVVVARLYIRKKWQVLKTLNIPHDPPSILGLGNLGAFIKNPDAIFDAYFLRKKKFGRIYGSYIWLQPRITIADPQILKQIFIKEAGIFRDRQKALSKINGKEMNTALTAATGDQWKRIRSTISPTFSTTKLKEMIGIFEQCANKMIRNLFKDAVTNNGRFDAKDVFGKLSLDVICSSAFSADVHTQEGDESELVKQSKRLFRRSFFQNPVVFLSLLFPSFEKIAEKLNLSVFPTETLQYYKRLTEVVIERKKDSSHKARVDIMQQMLKNEISEGDVKAGALKGITRNEIIGNSIIMILGGYETTASTLLFFAYCLATNKQEQDILRKEIQDSVEKQNGLTYEAIANMKFLDMCMKESQRLYGAIPANSRHSEKDITVNGVHIPAGITVDVPVYGMAHDEEYWDEPWEYRPERFEDMSKIDPMVFQPFGAGPRSCIAMRFAITEVKLAMCKLLLNFDLDVCDDTPAPPLKVCFRGSMQTKETVFLKVTPLHDSPEKEATAER